LTYAISGGKIIQVIPNLDEKSLMVEIESISNGTLVIKLPREVIDAKFAGEDDSFIVLLDGLDVDFDESTTGNERTLTIQYPEGTEDIEIIGTYVIPEFGGIAVLILMVSVFSVIFVSRNKLGFYTKI